MTADEALIGALRALSGALTELGAPSMIIGGLAVIARGVPRQTIDIDATVWTERLEIDHLFEVLGRHPVTVTVHATDERANAMTASVGASIR